MSGEEKTKVKDESNEHIYFIVTPRLVWALSEDPYEYTFWNVIKDIAGEKGECILSRDDMATLAMMSGGKASQCRDSLIAKKLLIGEFRKDPGYPQPVWHLSIPDFWEANVRWAKKYITIRERIDFKREQRGLKEPSPRDDSKKPSRSDKGVTPNDGGVSPGDLKNNVLEDSKEENIKNTLLELISDLKYSLFSTDIQAWFNVRDILERPSVSITGDVGKRPSLDDPAKIVISGLSEKPKGGQFTLAQIWEDRFTRSFANIGIDITFTE
jgi:hypothetical protein